jgi:hypothetical protein
VGRGRRARPDAHARRRDALHAPPGRERHVLARRAREPRAGRRRGQRARRRVRAPRVARRWRAPRPPRGTRGLVGRLLERLFHRARRGRKRDGGVVVSRRLRARRGVARGRDGRGPLALPHFRLASLAREPDARLESTGPLDGADGDQPRRAHGALVGVDRGDGRDGRPRGGSASARLPGLPLLGGPRSLGPQARDVGRAGGLGHLVQRALRRAALCVWRLGGAGRSGEGRGGAGRGGEGRRGAERGGSVKVGQASSGRREVVALLVPKKGHLFSLVLFLFPVLTAFVLLFIHLPLFPTCRCLAVGVDGAQRDVGEHVRDPFLLGCH